MAERAVEVVAEHAQRAADRDLFSDDVVRRAALDLAEREQRVLMRVDVARDDRLHHRDQLRRDDDGVNAHLRRGRVRALAVHGDVKVARLRHEIVPADADPALRHGRPQVQTVDAVHPRVFERAVVDHAPRAGPALFAGLEQQHHVAVQVRAVFGDPACEQQQDRHVPVVTAAVHAAGALRAVGHVVCLVVVNAVHVGAQGDGLLRVLGEKDGLHPADGRRLQPVGRALAQLVEHIRLRVMQLEADLGDAVQILPDAHGVVIHGCDLFTQVHKLSLRAGTPGAVDSSKFFYAQYTQNRRVRQWASILACVTLKKVYILSLAFFAGIC